MRKPAIKFAFSALAAIGSLVYLGKGILWLLGAIGTAETAGGILENRGAILNWLVTVSQGWPLALFLTGVFGLLCLKFGPPTAWLSELTNESPQRRQALLVKIRDLMLATPKQPFDERVDVIGALIRFSDEFKNEKHVVWTCDELAQRGFENPFKLLASTAPGIFNGCKLEFLREARTGMIDVRRNTSALSFLAKYWTHAGEYIKAHRKFIGFPENEPEPAPMRTSNTAAPKQIDKLRVGFLQLDRIDFHRGKAFIAGERFEMTAWFANRGQFPVYKAQVFALLCFAPTVYAKVDEDMCRELTKAITAQWEKGQGSQVAVGGSICFKTAIKAMPQEQIDQIMSGEGRIYLATRARWSNDAGEEMTPGWEACSCLEPPASADASPLTLKWRIVS